MTLEALRPTAYTETQTGGSLFDPTFAYDTDPFTEAWVQYDADVEGWESVEYHSFAAKTFPSYGALVLCVQIRGVSSWSDSGLSEVGIEYSLNNGALWTTLASWISGASWTSSKRAYLPLNQIISQFRVRVYCYNVGEPPNLYVRISDIRLEGISPYTKSMYISDTGNDRIVELSMPDLDFIGSSASYYNNYTDTRIAWNGLSGICNDGTHLYVAQNYNDGLNDISSITKVLPFAGTFSDYYLQDHPDELESDPPGDFNPVVGGITGSGNNEFNIIRDICTDGTHLYIVDSGNRRIKKYLCSDLTYIDQITTFNGSDAFTSYINGITTNGINIYVTDRVRSVIFKCLDLSYVGEFDVGADANTIDNDGSFVYTGGPLRG